MASLATGSSNFFASVNSNAPELIEYLGKKMIENGVKPEIEAFDVAMITNIGYYLKKSGTTAAAFQSCHECAWLNQRDP